MILLTGIQRWQFLHPKALESGASNTRSTNESRVVHWVALQSGKIELNLVNKFNLLNKVHRNPPQGCQHHYTGVKMSADVHFFQI